MTASVPPALTFNPLLRMAGDLRAELATRGAYPPGDTSFSLSRTHRIATDPLPVLLSAYERYGPVFSVRVLHGLQVFLLGPEANHHVTVSNAANFRWRDGGLGELTPLLGDGLLTIDGAYHRRARRIMLPAFHRDQIAAAAGTMVEEAERALEGWSPGQTLDVYAWARELAMRIALRALLGLDPDDGDTGELAAREFEKALSFYGTEYALRTLRGPGSPWRRMHAARRVLDRIVFAEIARRRSAGPSEGRDILGMLMAATDEDGSRLSDREVRDQAVTLLFAGHDTSTSTISFMLYELARHPAELDRLTEEANRVLGDRAPTAADLMAGLPRLEMASTRRSGCTRPRGSVPAAPSTPSRWPVPACRVARWSTTAPGPATGCPRSSPSPRRSCPSGSLPRPRRPCRRGRTSPSAVARARASGCASASWRSRR